MHDLQTRAIPVGDLRTYHRNPRRGNTAVIGQSLTVNGQYRPIVVNAGTHTGRPNEVLAGNHTLMAARDLGWESVAAVTVDVDDDQAARIVAADNRTADLGEYDERLLLELLAELPDLDGTGYEPGDIAELEKALADSVTELEPQERPEDTPAAPAPKEPVTRPGDVWRLGPHRIICGDSRDYETVTTLLDGAPINVAFTSPPYASQRKYDESSGFKPIPPDEYSAWFEDVQANVRAHLAADGSWFVNIKAHCDDGQRHLYVHDLLIAHVRQWGWRFVDELCWVDTKNGVPGGWPNRFKDAWEPVYHFCMAAGIKFNALANGTVSGAVFDYSPATATTGSGSGLLGEKATDEREGIARPSNVVQIPAGGDGTHSAQFPVKLPAWFIRAYSDPGDVVFDPFMGSGTTLIAADNEGRVAYGTEISPNYCDVICRRFQEHTGTKPTRDGEPHDFTAA